MITLILMIQNTREEQILKAAFEQMGVKAILAKPNYQNYVLMLQYLPDVVFIELPHICIEHLAFAKRLRAFKRTKTIPIVGYGNKVDEMVKRGISQNGFTTYIERPIKFTVLVKLFSRHLKAVGKSFDTPPQISDKEKDLDLIINSDALPMQKIDAMIRHISSLLAFPFTVAKVLQITQNEKAGAQNLANAIISDPSISTHILKVANSVFFASANHRITSIKDAIVRIGFNETRKIVMSMHVMKLFENKSKSNGFDRVDFWYHSLSVGIICEKIAKLIGDINTETAFLAGLLHDLGIILLDEYLTPVFDRALEETARNSSHYIDTEKTLYNITHNDLIGGLFPLWKIPQDITDAILFQFKIDEFNGSFDTLGKKLSLCVAVSNVIAKALHLGRECDEFSYAFTNEYFQMIHLQTGIQKNFIDQVKDELAMYQSFLSLEKRVFTCELCESEQIEKYTIAVFTPGAHVFIPVETHVRNIGMKVLRVSSLSQLNPSLHQCCIIWDPEGIMTFNSETSIADEVSAMSSEQEAPQQLSTGSGVATIFMGVTKDKPDGFPDVFTYLSSSVDLRMFVLTLGRVLNVIPQGDDVQIGDSANQSENG